MNLTGATSTQTTRISVSDVRRGMVVVDGAGDRWAVQATACPIDDMAGVYLTLAGTFGGTPSAGTFRYLTNDTVTVEVQA